MNVDLSFRTIPDEQNIVVVEGICTYKIAAMFDQKMSAVTGRTAARDLFDLGFITTRFGDKLWDGQIQNADQLTRDYESLAERYDPAFRKDLVLRELATAADRALVFRIAVEEQLAKRGSVVIEQSTPSGWPLARILALHKMWLDSSGTAGLRANLCARSFRNASLCNMNFERALLAGADFTGADLRHANLKRAILQEAVFDGTDLRGADLTGADLTGTTMRRETLDLTAKGLTEALTRTRSQPVRKTSRAADADRTGNIEPELEIYR